MKVDVTIITVDTANLEMNGSISEKVYYEP